MKQAVTVTAVRRPSPDVDLCHLMPHALEHHGQRHPALGHVFRLCSCWTAVTTGSTDQMVEQSGWWTCWSANAVSRRRSSAPGSCERPTAAVDVADPAAAIPALRRHTVVEQSFGSATSHRRYSELRKEGRPSCSLVAGRLSLAAAAETADQMLRLKDAAEEVIQSEMTATSDRE